MYISIDIGGTNVRVASTDNLETGQIVDRVQLRNNHNFEEYFQKIIEFAKKQGQIKGVGISVIGDLNPKKTIVIDTAPNAPEIINQSLVDKLKRQLNCEIFMENDGTAMALGEAVYTKKENDFICIIWGTGIGGAQVKKDKNRLKIEQIDWYKHLKDWEHDCGGEAIEKKYAKKPQDLIENEWKFIMYNFEKHLNRLVRFFEAKLVIFGGGVSLNQFRRIEAIQKNINAFLQLSELGDDAGLLGGFAMIKLDKKYS